MNVKGQVMKYQSGSRGGAQWPKPFELARDAMTLGCQAAAAPLFESVSLSVLELNEAYQ